MKGVMCFWKEGKLSPRYMGPFGILDRVGEVVHCLALPPSMTSVYNVFYLSILRKYVVDLGHLLRHVVLDIELEAT